jgi:hypothetical protein
MIDTFFHRPAVRERLASGLLGPYLETLATTELSSNKSIIF